MNPGSYRTCYLCKFIQLLENQGVDAQPFVDAAGLNRAHLFARKGETDPESYKRLMLAAIDEGVLPDIGLVIGEGITLFDLGLSGMIIYCSATLEKGINRWVRFQYLVDPPITFRMIRKGDQVALRSAVRLNEFMQSEARLRFAVEEAFVEWSHIGHLLGKPGQWFSEVRVSYAEPAYAQRYDEAFGCPAVFDQPYNEFLLPTEYLNLSFDFAAEDVATMIEHKCSSILQESKNYDELIYRIRGLVMKRPDEQTSIQEIASALHVSERTLRRRLLKFETTFKDVVIDCRMDMARTYLSSTELPISAISEMVGYSDTANFHRAFRKKSSLTPDEFRQQNAT